MDETELPSPLAGLGPEALRALHEAALAIVGGTGYDAPLQTIVDAARRLAGAHCGALAVLDEEGARLYGLQAFEHQEVRRRANRSDWP